MEALVSLVFSLFMVVMVGGITVISLIAGLAVPGFFLWTLAKQAARNNELLTKGEQAPARIMAVSETGTYINHAPQLALRLEVQPMGRPAFHAQARTIASLLEIPRLQPGSIISVRFDPAAPNEVAVERLAA